jgi:hypothetical protein
MEKLQTLCGRKINPTGNYVDALAYSLQCEAFKEINRLLIPHERIVSAIRLIRRNWAKQRGFPGLPHMAVTYFFENKIDTGFGASELIGAGVFILIDRAVSLERKGRLTYSAAFMDDASQFVGYLRGFGRGDAHKIEELAKMIKSDSGKRAVSFRGDQVMKPQWQSHVKTCVERGVTVNNIGDLLNEPGYDPKISSIAPATLKSWAKEAAPGLKFKAGRPK